MFSKRVFSSQYSFRFFSSKHKSVQEHAHQVFENYSDLIRDELKGTSSALDFYGPRIFNRLEGFRLGLIHSDQNYQDFIGLLSSTLSRFKEPKNLVNLSRLAVVIGLKDVPFYESLADSFYGLFKKKAEQYGHITPEMSLDYLEFVYNLSKSQMALQSHDSKYIDLSRQMVQQQVKSNLNELECKRRTEMMWVSHASNFQEEKLKVLNFWAQKFKTLSYSSGIQELQTNLQYRGMTANHLSDFLWLFYLNKFAEGEKSKELVIIPEFDSVISDSLELFLLQNESEYDRGLQNYEFQDTLTDEMGVCDPLLWRSLAQVFELSTKKEFYYKNLTYRLTDALLRKAEISLIDWESGTIIVESFLKMPTGFDHHPLIRVLDMLCTQIEHEGETLTYELNPANILKMTNCMVQLGDSKSVPIPQQTQIMKFIQESIEEEMVEGEWSEDQMEKMENLSFQAKNKGILEKEIKFKEDTIAL